MQGHGQLGQGVGQGDCKNVSSSLLVLTRYSMSSPGFQPVWRGGFRVKTKGMKRVGKGLKDQEQGALVFGSGVVLYRTLLTSIPFSAKVVDFWIPIASVDSKVPCVVLERILSLVTHFTMVHPSTKARPPSKRPPTRNPRVCVTYKSTFSPQLCGTVHHTTTTKDGRV